MRWSAPSFVDIAMNAEFAAYCEDDVVALP